MEAVALELTGVVALGIGAYWLAWRLHVPSILFLLIGGFVAGGVLGLIDPDALLGELLFPIVSLSVAIILFEGGLSLDVAELSEIGVVLRRLVTAGALVTWVGSALLAHLVLGFDLPLATLLGALLVVTGPTVIVPLLRHVRPADRIGSIVRWEGIVNDPIGAILAVLVFEVVLSGGFETVPDAALGILKAAGAGGGLGLAGAAVLVFVLKRYWVPDFLQNPAALAVALSVFTISNLVQTESGLLAVTVMGSAVASQRIVPIRHIIEFKETLRVLLISVLFVLLAARVTPAVVVSSGMASLLFIGGLILFVRPASVAVSTVGSELSWRERGFLAVMAPRGIVAAAVSSLFALELARAGYPGAERLASVTFVVIVGTVAVYGLSAAPVARWLGVASPNPQGLLIVGAEPWVRALAMVLHGKGIKVLLVDSNWAHVAAARRFGLPAHYGNILSEHVMDELELDGIGRLLALTSNHEVNSLAALHFSEVFGRSKVYQLPPGGGERGRLQQAIPTHLRGRFLFAREATHGVIADRFDAGAVIKGTGLTESFDFDDLRRQHGEDTLPLFALKESGELVVFAATDKIAPKPGHVVISLISGPPE